MKNEANGSGGTPAAEGVDPAAGVPPPAVGGKWKLVIGVLLVIGLIIASRVFPVGDWLKSFNDWMAGLGTLGIVIFVAVYVLAAVLFLPGSVLTLGAGFAFGVAKGFVAVSVGATLGAAAAFLIARHFARDSVSRKFGANASFSAVDRAVGREGAKIVFLLRLSPIFPFNVLNYLLGLTSVGFWPYAFASWAGMLPGTLLYVYLGYAGRAGLAAASGETDGSTLKYVYLGAGLLATLAVTIHVTRLARRALKQANGSSAGDPSTN